MHAYRLWRPVSGLLTLCTCDAMPLPCSAAMARLDLGRRARRYDKPLQAQPAGRRARPGRSSRHHQGRSLLMRGLAWGRASPRLTAAAAAATAEAQLQSAGVRLRNGQLAQHGEALSARAARGARERERRQAGQEAAGAGDAQTQQRCARAREADVAPRRVEAAVAGGCPATHAARTCLDQAGLQIAGQHLTSAAAIPGVWAAPGQALYMHSSQQCQRR